MYRLVRPVLFMFDSETIHEIAKWFCAVFAKLRLQKVIAPLYAVRDPRLEVSAFGLRFSSPVGLAAGFDKNGILVDFLPTLGFSHIEVGTVTPKPQPGNERPRLFRLVKDHALLNRMGFNNEGMLTMHSRLQQRKTPVIIGGNIGKNKDTQNDDAALDYERCFNALFDVVDYFVVNVSSPNTPGLRTLQDKEPLQQLLGRLQALNAERPERKPIVLKIAPDLTDPQLDDVIAVVLNTKVDGIIATNTTLGRGGLSTDDRIVEAMGAGGLSGSPLRARSTEVISYLFRHLQGRVPIIGVGGIFTAEDAYEKIRAGASLVQVYTGMIYEGPSIVKKINRSLLRLIERDGHTSISDAVGTQALASVHDGPHAL